MLCQNVRGPAARLPPQLTEIWAHKLVTATECQTLYVNQTWQEGENIFEGLQQEKTNCMEHRLFSESDSRSAG